MVLSWSLGLLGAAPAWAGVWALVERKYWSFSSFPWFPDWSVLPQVSTHHLHSSSEDEDIESAFPNELTLQQVSWEHLHYSQETRCSSCLWSILLWSSFLNSAPSPCSAPLGFPRAVPWPGIHLGAVQEASGMGGVPELCVTLLWEGVGMRISHTSV